jgi:hypothetical protein
MKAKTVKVELIFSETTSGDLTVAYESTDRAVGIFTMDAVCKALGVEGDHDNWIN